VLSNSEILIVEKKSAPTTRNGVRDVIVHVTIRFITPFSVSAPL